MIYIYIYNYVKKCLIGDQKLTYNGSIAELWQFYEATTLDRWRH